MYEGPGPTKSRSATTRRFHEGVLKKAHATYIGRVLASAPAIHWRRPAMVARGAFQWHLTYKQKPAPLRKATEASSGVVKRLQIKPGSGHPPRDESDLLCESVGTEREQSQGRTRALAQPGDAGCKFCVAIAQDLEENLRRGHPGRGFALFSTRRWSLDPRRGKLGEFPFLTAHRRQGNTNS